MSAMTDGEPGQVLGEVLHHVVAFRLAVDQHVQADVLLQRNHAVDLGPHDRLVGTGVDAPGPVIGAGPADLAGLRERPDRGGGQHGQAVGLRFPADGVGAAGRAVSQRPQPGPDLGIHRRGRSLPGGQLSGDGVPALRGNPAAGAGRHWWARLTANDLKAHQLPDPAGRYRRPAGW